MRQNVNWVLMASTRVWKLLMTYLGVKHNSAWSHEKSKLVLQFMGSIQYCTQVLRGISCPVFLEKMATSIWMSSLVDLLSGVSCVGDEIRQETIVECLRKVLQECEALSTTRSLVQVILIPKLEDYGREENLPLETQVGC